MRIQKIILISALVFLMCALIVIITTGQANGYELSIYAAYPALLWFCLFISVALGIIIILREAFERVQARWWQAGLGIILAGSLVLWLLPFIRGYHALDPQDSLGAIAYTQDIINTGHFNVGDFYPGMHILASFIATVGNLTLFEVSFIISAISNILFILGMILLVKNLRLSQKQLLIILALAAAPFFLEQLYAVPRNLAFDLLPCLLSFYFRIQNEKPNNLIVLLFFFLVSMVILHPFNGGLLFIAIFLIIWVSSLIQSSLKRGKNVLIHGIHGSTSLTFSLVILIALLWFLWYSNLPFFTNFIQYYSNINEWISSHLSYYQNVAALRKLSIADVVINFLRIAGHNLLFLILATVGSIYLFRKYIIGHKNNSEHLLAILLLFLFFSLFTLIGFILPFRIEYYRILPYAVMFAMVLSGWFLGEITIKRNFAIVIITTTCLISLLIGILNIFPSPWIQGGNSYTISRTTDSATQWIIFYQDELMGIDGVDVVTYQQIASLTGYDKLPYNVYHRTSEGIPPHLGYDKLSRVGSLYNDNQYWLVPASAYHDTERIPNYPSGWLLTPHDLEILHNDPSANLIYNNSGFETFYIYSIPKG